MTTETNGEREAPHQLTTEALREAGYDVRDETERRPYRRLFHSSGAWSSMAGIDRLVAALASRPAEPADSTIFFAHGVAAGRELERASAGPAVEPRAAGLTDEQIDQIADDGCRNASGGIYSTRVYEFARAILAAASPQPAAETEAVALLRELLAVKALGRDRAKADWKAAKTRADEDYDAADRLSRNFHRREKAAWEKAADIVACSPAPAAQGDCGNADCGWRGPLSDCSELHSRVGAPVGPLCPNCREIVEPDAEPSPTPALSQGLCDEAADRLKADANSIFNDPPAGTAQEVRDVLEWYDASIRAALAAAGRPR